MQRGNNLEQVAYLTIKEKILSKEWPPQAHITEVKTAGLLGISRTPVRKAFLRLADEGLLVIEAHKGAKIVEPQIDLKGYIERLEVLELIFVEYVHYLELKEIKLDLGRLDQELHQLIQLIKQVDTLDYQESERQFLRTFLSFGHNRFKTAVVSEILRNLHLQKNQELAVLIKSNTAKKLQHYSKIIDLLRTSEYGLVRKQIRILMNQLMLSAVRSD